VHMHGGTVWVCHKDGPGTRIEVVLPLSTPAANEVEPVAPGGPSGGEA